MHLHGHSNHNARVPKDMVASMQWHSVEADLTGAADVLWWSDHTQMFDQTSNFAIDVLRRPISVEPDLSVTNLTKDPTLQAYAVRFEARHDGGTPFVTADDGGLEVRLVSDPSPDWQRLSHEPKSGAAHPLIHHGGFSRPVSSGAMMELDLDCDAEGPDAHCEIQLELAWHHDDGPVHHRVTYRIDSEVEARQRTSDSPGHVEVTIPAREGEGGVGYSVDLLADAGHLPFGDDNTLHRLHFGVAARQGAAATLRLRKINLTSHHGDRAHQVRKVEEFASRYGRIYAQEQHVGFEYGDPLAHVNGFLPRPPDSESLSLVEPSGTYPARAWIARIHELGGLASLNHPFLKLKELCGRRSESECVQRVADQLLDEGALGADLLEVGYVHRGLGLRAHLDLWDVLTANGLYLYGTGVTDSHGGEWSLAKNSFTVWILAPSPKAPDLLQAAARGRMFFGDPLGWNGVFAFKLGEHFMGARVRVPGGVLPLEFVLEPWERATEVYLVQGSIRAGEPLEYRHRRTPLEREAPPVEIDTSSPGFVRLEAWRRTLDGDLAPVAFTNPVVLTPP